MKSFLISLIFLLSISSFAANELIVHVTEFGVGKFHRGDNKVHPYEAQNAWKPYVLPDNAGTTNPLTVKNDDGSYTVFFSTLDEMMTSVVQIAQTENRPVSVLNIHAHGLPGAMWFPKDAKALNGIGCSQWKDAASGSDQDNMSQYYSALSASDIRQIRQMSNGMSYTMPCTTGLKEWQQGVQKNPAFKSVLASDAQLHFLSCVVGLGPVGDNFTKGIASLLLNGQGHVATSLNFGLGDWSMPAGMGFWDYLNDEQLKRDNSVYPIHRQDSEIAQLGTIRLASFANGAVQTSTLTNQSFLPMDFDYLAPGTLVEPQNFEMSSEIPSSVRVPGTKVRLPLTR